MGREIFCIKLSTKSTIQLSYILWNGNLHVCINIFPGFSTFLPVFACWKDIKIHYINYLMRLWCLLLRLKLGRFSSLVCKFSAACMNTNFDAQVFFKVRKWELILYLIEFIVLKFLRNSEL